MSRQRKRRLVLIWIAASGLLCNPLPLPGQTPQIVSRYGVWTIDPFQPGFALLEPQAHITYGQDQTSAGLAYFPELPVRGSLVLPVFLVDWSDFNPATDPSNHDNSNSVFRSYVKKTSAELEQYLNATNGLAGYFNEVSGGQLQVRFRVFPWLESSRSVYLQDKEPAYYTTNSAGRWVADPTRLAKDVLRAAVVDLGLDLTEFDADQNRVLDGFVIVYEGWAGKLAGTNLAWTNPGYYAGPPPMPGLDNVATLVSIDDPNYARFQTQGILFSRYCNLPEQCAPDGPDAPGQFNALSTWAHEIGHLLLGYRDYYQSPADLGYYALSARSGHPVPFHPAALEKWLFGKWIDAPIIINIGTYTLLDHHLRSGQTYATQIPYLCRVLLDGDPHHFLTLENRHFLPASQGGSQFNEQHSDSSLESGVVIFEVNLRRTGSDQIRRLLPPRCWDLAVTEDIGAFGPGDVLDCEANGFHVVLGDFSAPGPSVTFALRYQSLARIVLQAGQPCISFCPVPGLDHIVQYSESFQSTEWTDLPGSPHNTGSAVDPSAAGAAQRFYRVLLRAR
jgi:M6 family metalloprotease-like protein